MSENAMGWLWPLLKRNTSDGNWKGCANGCFLASILNTEDENKPGKRRHPIFIAKKDSERVERNLQKSWNQTKEKLVEKIFEFFDENPCTMSFFHPQKNQLI